MTGTESVSLTFLHWIVAALTLIGEPLTPHSTCSCNGVEAAEPPAHDSCAAPGTLVSGAAASAARATARGA
jgi:hypothetical protein